MLRVHRPTPSLGNVRTTPYSIPPRVAARNPAQTPVRCRSSPVLSPTRSTGTPARPSIDMYRLVSGRPLRVAQVPAAAELPRPSPRQQDGEVLDVVQVAVAHAAPVEQHQLIEQRGVPVRRRLQSAQVVRQQLRVIGAHARQLRQALRVVLVVRQGVVRVRHADLRIGLRGELRRHEEGDDARQVGLVSQHLQVEHQLHVVLERRRDAGRGPLHHRQLAVGIGLDALDAALHVAHRGQVVGELRAVRRPEPLAEAGHLRRHGVQDAPIALDPLAPRGGVGAGPVAEQALEEGARIALHRQRRGRRAPAQRADVGATEAGVAGAAELRQPDAHL